MAEMVCSYEGSGADREARFSARKEELRNGHGPLMALPAFRLLALLSISSCSICAILSTGSCCLAGSPWQFTRWGIRASVFSASSMSIAGGPFSAVDPVGPTVLLATRLCRVQQGLWLSFSSSTWPHNVRCSRNGLPLGVWSGSPIPTGIMLTKVGLLAHDDHGGIYPLPRFSRRFFLALGARYMALSDHVPHPGPAKTRHAVIDYAS